MHKLLLLSLLASASLFAQSFTASVRGIVTDTSKAAIPAAKITLTEADRGVTYSTVGDGEGRYALPSIPPGRYTLRAEAAGFRPYAQPVFTLEVQQSATIDVELNVGDVATSVNVEATAPLINTTIATLGQVVDNRFLVTSPIASRNPLSLTSLVPGIVPVTPGGVTSTNFIANGTRNSSADVLLDGSNVAGIEQNGGVTDVKYTPSVDVVEEFKVQTNFFSAEFGNTGGSIINIISKSGTNQLHGTIYEFAQNNVLNANSWFSNRAGQSLPDSKRNFFGGTMGGPLYVPKLYNGRNRTFFFVDFDGNKNETATTTTGTVPTLKQRAGDFSDTRLANGNLVVIYNPFDTVTTNGQTRRLPFAGNVIPGSMQNPIAKNIVPYYPLPTSEGNAFTHVNNFFAQGANASNNYKVDAKIDHNLSDKARISSRYSQAWGNSTPANLSGNLADNTNNGSSRTHSFVFDYTRTQNANTIYAGRIGLLRVTADNLPRSVGFDQTTLGFSSILQATGAKMFPQISASGYRGLGAGAYALIYRAEDVGSFSGSVVKILGAHTLKIGGEGRLLHENYYQPNLPAGGFRFNRAQTGQNPTSSSSSQGDAIASLLLGWGSGGTLTQDYPAATASQYFGMYAQNDWRITKRLTINLGFRYDFDVPRTERFDRLNWFDPYAPSPLAGKVPGLPNLLGVMKFVGDGNGRSPFFGDYNNVQPRVGFAFALNNLTSIRAGYGIFYTTNRSSIKGEVGPPFRADSAVQFSRDRDITPFATLQNPFPVGLTNPPGRNPLAFLGLGFDSPVGTSLNQQYQQWNFSVQRQVPGNGVVEVNYAGSKGTHLYVGTNDVLGNYNKLDPKYYSLGRDELDEQVPNPFFGIITDPRSVLSSPTVTRDQLLRPYPQYGGAVGNYLAPPNIGNSTYHSLQVKYEKRFSRGLSVISHYTWAKMLTDSDVTGGSDVDWLGGATTIQSWSNFRLEKSLSAFDISHRAVLSADYQLPIGRGRAVGTNMNRVLDGVLGGWDFNTIMTFSKGSPIAISLDSGNLWDADQRPNLIGDPSMPGSARDRMNGYFNVAAFSQPDDDVLGTAPRNLNYRAPGIANADVTAMKNFHFTERKYIQLRGEAYNVTNTPTFGKPNSAFGSSSFGVISGYAGGRGARTVQLAIKFYY